MREVLEKGFVVCKRRDVARLNIRGEVLSFFFERSVSSSPGGRVTSFLRGEWTKEGRGIKVFLSIQSKIPRELVRGKTNHLIWAGPKSFERSQRKLLFQRGGKERWTNGADIKSRELNPCFCRGEALQDLPDSSYAEIGLWKIPGFACKGIRSLGCLRFGSMRIGVRRGLSSIHDENQYMPIVGLEWLIFGKGKTETCIRVLPSIDRTNNSTKKDSSLDCLPQPPTFWKGPLPKMAQSSFILSPTPNSLDETMKSAKRACPKEVLLTCLGRMNVSSLYNKNFSKKKSYVKVGRLLHRGG